MTQKEMYNIQYNKAWYYHASDSTLSDDKLSRVSNKFAVKNTWIEYNKYLRNTKKLRKD